LLTKLDRKPELGDVKIYKYPKKLNISPTPLFDPKAFYAWNVKEFN
jgi:hypothetical protein